MITLLAGAASGCAGGPHRRGEHQLSLTGFFAHPFDNDGRGDSAAATVGYSYFLRDRLALTGAFTPYRTYNQRGGDAQAAEVQVGLRWYFWESGRQARPVAVFTEGLAGAIYSSRSVPEEGTCANLTAEIGVGCELPLADDVCWVTGCRLRHLSHGHILHGKNPGQDDQEIYMGVALSVE
jgi:hypothetical protein